jgi:exonuclease VII small subunit
MITGLFMVLLAQAATRTPTPTPTPPINLLLSKPSSEAQPAPTSLGDVAKKIKLRLPANQPKVLTNDSVKQLSKGVELTTSMADSGPVSAAPSSLTADAGKKAMWQERYKAAVARASKFEAEIARLNSEVARLETAFYATDDPAQRDGVIKPAWDKALADLRVAQDELAQARKEPEQVLDEARRDGAQPGWFRGLDQPGSGPAPRPTRPPGGS